MAPEEPSTDVLPASPERAAGAVESAPALVGRTLGKFTLVEQLGRGGSGDVFRAEQMPLGRSVVIKVLRHDASKVPNRVERFLREAKLASRLDHPYAAHVYAFGAEPDGVLWIAMEHVKGRTIDEIITKRGAIPATVFAPLFARLCEVVHTAHELGIIHRDIKSTNVMVIERAGQLLPKLLDFGIAKGDGEEVAPASPDPGVAEGLTGHGVTLGSPQYMAPEQWQHPHDVDARADIYALGVLGYRCLAGKLPFGSTDRAKLVDAHLQQAPPAMPDTVPPALAEAMFRALAKQPDKRWPTAIAFAEAVRRASGMAAPETVPIFDPAVRDAWLADGPQPIADAIAHLTSATTTVEVDAALRELVAITCRWVAVLALARLPSTKADPEVRAHARAVIGRDECAPWLRLARAIDAAIPERLAGLSAALAGSDLMLALADRLDDRDRARTAAGLAADVAAAAEALAPLQPLFACRLAVGRAGGVAESWQGPRRRERERVIVWGDPLAEGEVVLLDSGGSVVIKLSPLAQVVAPLPSAEPELFVLWRSTRGGARMLAAPWGFERDDDAVGERLAALSTEDSTTSAHPADDRSPWVGLAAYTATDADHFVGREREVEALANRMVRAPLLAVLGPSGVGKSSFVHAGLVPRLGDHHRVLAMRPGRHPMHALAALPPVSGDSHDEASIASRLRELGDSAPRGLVLVVDQLEELVTLCRDPDERRRFAETLAAAADGPDAPVRIVATLRDDFATVIEGEAALRGRWEVFVLAAPLPEALRRIVIEPPRRVAVAVEPRVVDDIVAEVAGRPASLPLLSFTLSQLWNARDREQRLITHAACTRLGGVAGALATYADEVYATLARSDQEQVRDVLARLVAADGTRIPMPRAELEQLPHARRVLAHLIDARLLVVRDDEGTDVVELVHECLAERWPRLARWRTEDAADRALLGDVRAAARRWLDGNQRADLLWRGEALAELRRLAARSQALTATERAFAEASAGAERRARRLRRGIVAGAMVVLAGAAGVMAYLGAVANTSRAAAEQSAVAAQTSARLAEDRLTQSFVAQGRRDLGSGRALQALALFGEALRRGADTPGLREMIGIASRAWPGVITIQRANAYAQLTGSPSGWIAGATTDGRIRWWSERGEPVADIDADAGQLMSLRRLADDGLIACGSKAVVLYGPDRRLRWRVHTVGDNFFAYPGPASDEVSVVDMQKIRVYGLDGTVRRSAPSDPQAGAFDQLFDPTGHRVFMGTRGEDYWVDLVTMQRHWLTRQGHSTVAGASDGSVFGYLDRERRIHLVDSEGREQRTLETANHPDVLQFSATGDRIAAIGERTIDVLDRTGRRLAHIANEPGQSMLLLRGDDVWIGGTEGVLRHYREGILVASLPLHVSEIMVGALAGNVVATYAAEPSLALTRADFVQLERDKTPCDRPSYEQLGQATIYVCGDHMEVSMGRHSLGTIPNTQVRLTVAWEDSTQRGAISMESGVIVRDADNHDLARESLHRGPIAFEDGDHLLIVDVQTQHVLRWTFGSNQWQDLAAGNKVLALAWINGALVLGNEDGSLVVLRDGHEEARLPMGEPVMAIEPSADRHWLAAQLPSASTVVVDTQTWKISRRFEASDAYGASATFDQTGELLVRVSRGEPTIWERATGEALISDLDLLRGFFNARFLPDGRIETAAGPESTSGLLQIRPDTRPVPEILRDLACKVPFKVVDGRLEPTTPACR